MKMTSKFDSEAFKTTILIPYVHMFILYRYSNKFFSCCNRMKEGVVNARGSGDGVDIKIIPANDSGY